MSDVTYPRQLSDLHGLDEFPDLYMRTKENRQTARVRIGLSEEALATILDVDVATVRALESGVLDTTTDAEGYIAPLPEIAYPNAAVKRLVFAYSRFLNLCQHLPPRVMQDEVSHHAYLDVGEADAMRVAELRRATQGF